MWRGISLSIESAGHIEPPTCTRLNFPGLGEALIFFSLPFLASRGVRDASQVCLVPGQTSPASAEALIFFSLPFLASRGVRDASQVCLVPGQTSPASAEALIFFSLPFLVSRQEKEDTKKGLPLWISPRVEGLRFFIHLNTGDSPGARTQDPILKRDVLYLLS